MKASVSGRLSGVAYSGITSLQLSAETKRDEITLKNVLEYYVKMSAEVESDTSADKEWTSLHAFISAENGCCDFYEIMLAFDKPLTESEISRASGCLGYALREMLAGEDLSEPDAYGADQGMRLSYYYDSTKSRRDDPDYFAAFEKALLYINEGTPVRTTNRAGIGTKGTRLVEGIGPRKVNIFLR